jgi:hypothetical protein
MNRNTKARKAAFEGKIQPRKSLLDEKGNPKPKVGYPNKPKELKGPSIMEQMAMLGCYKNVS